MKRYLLGSTALVTVALLYQNCGSGFVTVSVDARNLSSQLTGPSTTPSSKDPAIGEKPNPVPGCLTDSKYNACIFYKNPVAQTGSAFSTPLTFGTDLDDIQIQAVNITGLTDPNHLVNNSLTLGYIPFKDQAGQIINPPGCGPNPLQSNNGTWKFHYSNDASHAVAQLMAYYWLNSEIVNFKIHAGGFYGENQNIQVDPYSLVPTAQNNAFFMPPAGQPDGSVSPPVIIMGRVCLSAPGQIDLNCQDSSFKHEAAISAEVYTHEMGHANFYYSSPGRALTCIKSPEGTSTSYTSDIGCPEQTCPEANNNTKATPRCCKSPDGCIGAFNEGQADFHSALMFPSNPKLGETFMDSLGGLVSGGRVRDVTKNTTQLSTDTFYNASSSNPYKGEIHAMGTVYAAAWWNLWSAASNQTEIQQLFTDHLPLVDPRDTFPKILGRILSLDMANNQGRNQDLIKQSFAAVGIVPLQ